MRNALIAVLGVSAVASLAAQQAKPAKPAPPAKPAAAAAKPARTADGHPDFTGMYDLATMTPVERLPGMKDLVLTKEQADAAENYEAQRNAKDDQPLKSDRGAPPTGGERPAGKSYLEQLEFFGGGVVGGYNRFWLAEGSKLATVEGQKRSSIVIDPPDGHVPPTNAIGKKRNAAFLAGAVSPDAAESASSGPPGAFDGPELRPLAERCLMGFSSTAGPPALPNYFYNNLHQIVQTRDTVMILTEMVHDARVVRMNQPHLPPSIRKWMGDSVGHWEGDTLVIDTTNFTGKTQFRGSSDKLHVVERISRMSDGNLLYRFTVEDPDTWDRAWTGEYPWVVTHQNMYEYACAEGNYALEDMLRGARQAEADKNKK
ncbi:MAG TPA: hypothetical protein VFA27_16975 [Vicinamibacterales bacterium]|nr:hypothetical protein [Vicinamibacterales bacterium]